MKVVLRQDVQHLGERGQIVNVAPGYARNYLLPKRLAAEATPGNLRNLELEKKLWMAREAKDAETARGLAERLGAVHLTVARKAGESDTLYGSVTSGDVAELLAAQGFQVDRRKIQLEEPIKKLGEFTVPIKLHRQVTVEIPLRVIGEEG